MLFSDLQQLFLALLCENHFVHPVESFFERIVVVTLLKRLTLNQLFNKVLFYENRNFFASMTVKNSEYTAVAR